MWSPGQTLNFDIGERDDLVEVVLVDDRVVATGDEAQLTFDAWQQRWRVRGEDDVFEGLGLGAPGVVDARGGDRWG